jgi:hypothetical protein
MDRSSRSHTRRAAVQFLSGCALAAPAVLRAPSARAIKGWCRRDPIIKIGDLTVQISLFSDTEMHKLATGPTQLFIKVPAGIATRFVADDPGFGHLGYDVWFAESRELIADARSVDVQLEAYAPAASRAAGPLPLLLEFIRRGGGVPAVFQAEGRANEWVSLRANLAVRDFDESDDTPPVVLPPSSEDASDDTPPALPTPSEDESEVTPPSAVQDTEDRKKQKKRRGKKKSS